MRNTDYFKEVESYLIHHPNSDNKYFDKHNYRYQTIQFPGKITPAETYSAINGFYNKYLSSPEHIRYVSKMCSDFPDTRPFFHRQLEGGV